LFHPDWGPWIHLRVMATTAKLDVSARVFSEQLCDQCGLCISECPADAISDEDFEGMRCRSYRKARGEYEPYGPRGEFRYCKCCILTCPKGKQPIPRPSLNGNVEQDASADARKPHR
jgi:epoxyqueuosine reductase QueG